MTDDIDVGIIGSGLGGLTAAAFLAAAGKRVMLFERAHIPGGNATSYSRRAARFDVGLHYLGECEDDGIVRWILDSAGAKVTFRRLDSQGFDIVRGPTWELAIPCDWSEYRERLVAQWPAHRADLVEYFRLVGAIGEAVRGSLRGAVTVSPATAAPALIRLLRHRNTTVAELFDRLGFPPDLRAQLSAYNAYYGLPPSRTPLILHAGAATHFRRGAYYPIGGAGAITDALVDVIERNGGQIRLLSEVERILVRRHSVEGLRIREKGTSYDVRVSTVVSNADWKRTVLELLGQDQTTAGQFSRAASAHTAYPMYLLSLLIDRDLHAEGFGARNFLDIGDIDLEAQYLALDRGRMPERPQVLFCSANLKDPSAQDSAPIGCSSIQLMSPVPGDPRFWGAPAGPASGVRYRRRESYLAAKKSVSDQLVAAAESIVPGLRSSIVHTTDGSPFSHERFIGSSGGSPYGLSSTPDQFMLNRPLPVTGIRGLYLVGANVVFGSGVVSAMVSGSAVATLLLRSKVVRRTRVA
ncbi:phytoene desaturase family protein [Nocardia sp. NPDC058658]|uniref:phytoene desaturase family protein n=1 Tax=Nocardia sp. NPDC058658 TaxID=3346580 RepID=UPI003662451D